MSSENDRVDDHRDSGGVPRVRAVVLNYNGGDHVVRCVDALLATRWPQDRLDVVVVDNASSDGSDAEIARRFPSVTILPTGENLGFPANNQAMGEVAGLESPDHIALVNNDAFVDPDWLEPLVSALDADPGLGAVCPRIRFARDFVDVTIRADAVVPGRGDPRQLGVQLHGVRVDGDDVWADAQRFEGFWGVEQAPDGPFEWTDAEARLRVPVGVDGAVPERVQLTLQSDGTRTVTLDGGAGPVTVEVGEQPATVEVALAGRPYPVVNNVGSVLVEGGWGADRGFLEPDDGRYDGAADVFAWCGGGVLLRRRYLDEVGLFDDRFFLYYEDTDLSWRGRARGWSYRYVPEAEVRHLHAASSGEGSALFQHYVERNRLLMLVKNGPARLVLSAVVSFLIATASYARRDIVAPVLRRHRPNPTLTYRRLRSFGGFLRLAPRGVLHRWRNRRAQVVDDAELLDWAVPR